MTAEDFYDFKKKKLYSYRCSSNYIPKIILYCEVNNKFGENKFLRVCCVEFVSCMYSKLNK